MNFICAACAVADAASSGLCLMRAQHVLNTRLTACSSSLAQHTTSLSAFMIASASAITAAIKVLPLFFGSLISRIE